LQGIAKLVFEPLTMQLWCITRAICDQPIVVLSDNPVYAGEDVAVEGKNERDFFDSDSSGFECIFSIAKRLLTTWAPIFAKNIEACFNESGGLY